MRWSEVMLILIETDSNVYECLIAINLKKMEEGKLGMFSTELSH